MAASVYIKSLLWLAGLGSIGYGLLQLTTPSENKINEIKSKYSSHLSKDEKQKLLLLQELKKSSERTPTYLEKSKDTK